MGDTQVVEIIGRHWLIGELLRAGLEVALPVRDRGVDLLVYAGEELAPDSFVARPIQLKAATKESFGIDRKTEVAGLPIDQGIHTVPPLCTKEGKPASRASRKPVPIAELFALHERFAGQLRDLPDGATFNVVVTEK